MVARACGVRARVCVHKSVRAIVCVCNCQDAVTKIHKPIFVNIQPSQSDTCILLPRPLSNDPRFI